MIDTNLIFMCLCILVCSICPSLILVQIKVTFQLQTQVCGLNYATEGPMSEPILIKPDSEYPDWLFKMNVKRPKPTLNEMVSNRFFRISGTFGS